MKEGEKRKKGRGGNRRVMEVDRIFFETGLVE